MIYTTVVQFDTSTRNFRYLFCNLIHTPISKQSINFIKIDEKLKIELKEEQEILYKNSMFLAGFNYEKF